MTKSSKKRKGRIGSSLDEFLKEDGIYEDVTARAIKRVLARQLGDLMKREHISKTELAARMKTSRAQLDRLLDPENESVTLGTLTRAAQAVGRHLRMELASESVSDNNSHLVLLALVPQRKCCFKKINRIDCATRAQEAITRDRNQPRPCPSWASPGR